ncbi:MAG TPA: hypothetical protein VJY62_04810 [Bacteroidia bacterium]|nr:hypothetical protein [Bacteroidia bacterium]
MKTKLLFAAFVFILCSGMSKTVSPAVLSIINITEFYDALQSEDTVKINSFLKVLADDTALSSIACKGALLMRKSGFQKSAKRKLEMFKQGRILLEDAIKKENDNAEFRFLRLIIQENCPAFLKYHDKIKEDADAVKHFYKNFSAELKHAVADYSKVSKSLKPDSFAD